MACVPWKPSSRYCSWTVSASPKVLDDLEGATERQHFAPFDVFEVVGQRLELTVVANKSSERIAGLALHTVDLGADLGEPGLDLDAVPFESLGKPESGLTRLGQDEPYDNEVAGRPVQSVSCRIGAPMLHGLEHPGDFLSDVARSVAMNNPGYSTHVVLLALKTAP